MKNFNGTPLEINQIQGVDFLGYELIDKENGIRYELVNEPWVSLAAAAKNGGSRREVLSETLKVVLTDGQETEKLNKYLPEHEKMIKVDESGLVDLIHRTDFNFNGLIIYVDTLQRDFEFNTNLLLNCVSAQIIFVGKPFQKIADLGTWEGIDVTKNLKPYQIWIYGDQIPVTIKGNMEIGCESIFGGIFLIEGANVIFDDFGFFVNPSPWNGTIYNPALNHDIAVYERGFIMGTKSARIMIQGKLYFYFFNYISAAAPSEDKLQIPSAFISVKEGSSVALKGKSSEFKFHCVGTETMKWIMPKPAFRVGSNCEFILMPEGNNPMPINNQISAYTDTDCRTFMTECWNKIQVNWWIRHFFENLPLSGITNYLITIANIDNVDKNILIGFPN